MARSLLAVFILLLSVASLGISQQQSVRLDPPTFIGAWRVDLRPTPTAPAYYQTFEVRAIEGETFTGTFYGAEIRNGRINRDWDALYFAFTTEDGSGVYNHSGKLFGNRLEGTTHSLGRNFLAVWRAERERRQNGN